MRDLDAWVRERKLAALCLSLGGLVLVAYLPALRNGFVWDDDDNVTANATLRTLSGLASIWTDPLANQQYYPLLHTSFWIEFQIWGLHPLGYHAVNIALQALDAVLLFLLLGRLRVPGAFWVAALFAVHPVQVESVAWITERKNVLSAAFYFASALAYVDFAGLAGEAREARGRSYGIALALFLAALLSKTATSTLPAALAIVTWWKRGALTRSDAAALAPFFVLGAALAKLTSWIEHHHVGAHYDWSFPTRLLIAGRAFWFYVAKLAWPRELVFIYPRWSIDTRDVVQWAYPLAAVGLLLGLWLARPRIGRGPLAAVAYYVVTVLPALGFFDVAFHRFAYVQDHFQYLAGIGVEALVVATVCLVHARSGGLGRRALPLVGGALLSVLVARTWARCAAYESFASLFGDTVLHNGASVMPLYNLGADAARRGKRDEAMTWYRRAVAVDPRDVPTRNNLGVALLEEAKVDPAKIEEAVSQLRVAETLSPADPEIRKNLAMALERQGHAGDAAVEYAEALRLRPGWSLVERMLAVLRATTGDPTARDTADAVRLAEDACARERALPSWPQCLDVLAVTYAEADRLDDAVRTGAEAAALARAAGDLARAARSQQRAASYEERRQRRGAPKTP